MGILLMLTGAGTITPPDPEPGATVRQILGQTAIAATTWQASGAQRDGMSATTKHPVLATVNNPVFHWLIETPISGTPAASTATMRAAVWTTASSTPVPMTFGGASSVTVPLSGVIASDAVPVTLTAGQDAFLHVWIDTTEATGNAPASTPNTLAGYDLGTTVGTWEASLSGTYLGSGVGNLPTLRPVGVYSLSTANSWLGAGTSILAIVDSFFDRTARDLGWASTKMAMGSEGFRHFPAAWTARYGDTLDKYTHVLCEHGANDVSTNPLATVQANAISYWNAMLAAGPQFIHQTTTLPQTTSTDGFATVENQTVKAFEAVRVAWNGWLRDGAPIIAGAAVAVGTSGALRVGDVGHPLTAIHDTCSVVESAPNSGKWLAGIGGDGTHPASAAHDLIKDYLIPRLIAA